MKFCGTLLVDDGLWLKLQEYSGSELSVPLKFSRANFVTWKWSCMSSHVKQLYQVIHVTKK